MIARAIVVRENRPFDSSPLLAMNGRLIFVSFEVPALLVSIRVAGYSGGIRERRYVLDELVV